MRPRSLPAAALVVMLLGCALAGQSKRSITETDLFQFTWIGDPQVSPDGASIAFVRVSVNAKKDGYDTALFVVATAGDAPPRRLTTGPRDSGPRWSPDGTRLVFMRALEQDGKRAAATALSPFDARRRAGTADGSAERRGQPEVVPGWHAHRLQERDGAAGSSTTRGARATRVPGRERPERLSGRDA